jgi:hypothetical protein
MHHTYKERRLGWLFAMPDLSDWTVGGDRPDPTRALLEAMFAGVVDGVSVTVSGASNYGASADVAPQGEGVPEILLGVLNESLKKKYHKLAELAVSAAGQGAEHPIVGILREFGVPSVADPNFFEAMASRYLATEEAAGLANVVNLRLLEAYTASDMMRVMGAPGGLAAHVMRDDAANVALQLLAPADIFPAYSLQLGGKGGKGGKRPTTLQMPATTVRECTKSWDPMLPAFPATIGRGGVERAPTVTEAVWAKMQEGWSDYDALKNPDDSAGMAPAYGIYINDARTYALANVSVLDAFVRRGTVLRVWFHQHATFLMATRAGGAVNVTINDPNASSFQGLEHRYLQATPCERVSTAAGWCQTWSTFELECRLAGASIHDALLGAFAVGPSAIQALFVGQFGGGDQTGWGCSLTRFVRCLAMRNIEIAKALMGASSTLVDKVLGVLP